MNIDNQTIKRAFLSLKANVYHESLNLYLKQRLAKFECGDLEAALTELETVLSSDAPLESAELNAWLEKITFRVIPKGASTREEKARQEHSDASAGLFLTNVTDSAEYFIEGVNYFIDAPVELHIVDTLWCALVGQPIDQELSPDCYSNRLDSQAVGFVTGENQHQGHGGKDIFKPYFGQYKTWRDRAINVARSIGDRGENVALLSIDFKAFFYHVDLDWEKLKNETQSSSDYQSSKTLNAIVEAIHEKYHSSIENHLATTHADCRHKSGLPIGLNSSGILTNYYLKTFDHDIHCQVAPAYYGRYVDDLIFIFRRPELEPGEGLSEFVDRYIKGVIRLDPTNNNYEAKVAKNSLPVQKDKLVLQFFDKNHSRAGLDLFMKELEERASAFQFLQDDAIESELDKYAFDILYEGSVHKPRSVVGVVENETELSRYLTAHLELHRFSYTHKSDSVLPQLGKFFRGVNILRRPKLWEKVYQYATILNEANFIWGFYRQINEAIQCSYFDGPPEFTNKIRTDLAAYNDVAFSMCLGLLDVSHFSPAAVALFNIDSEGLDSLLKLDLSEIPSLDKKIPQLQRGALTAGIASTVWELRKANLIRQRLCSWPLINYTNYVGTLVCSETILDKLAANHLEIDPNKQHHSPRFIHFEEWQLFHFAIEIGNNGGSPANGNFATRLNEYKSNSRWPNFPVTSSPIVEAGTGIETNHICVGPKAPPSTLNVAVANLQVKEDDIARAIRPDKTANISPDRLINLQQILDIAKGEKADLLVMPETSIPVIWLPYLVSYARTRQIGLVFGLEYWIVGNTAYNLVIEVLPFKVNGKYKSCTIIPRLKNHYAPLELEYLDSLRLQPATELPKNKGVARYHSVSWRGAAFATYNCFELANIEHRCLFKSKIDMLLAPVFNRDTNYYASILESAVRDIHCYVVQANSSLYGGSCVLQPTKTETRTMMLVKGGKNPTALTTTLDIPALRKFQYQSKPLKGDIYKQLPPGYDSDEVRNR